MYMYVYVYVWNVFFLLGTVMLFFNTRYVNSIEMFFLSIYVHSGELFLTLLNILGIAALNFI